MYPLPIILTFPNVFLFLRHEATWGAEDGILLVPIARSIRFILILEYLVERDMESLEVGTKGQSIDCP